MASSGQTISPGALRYLKYFYFVRHWGKKVFFLVFDHLFLAGQSKTIREVLEDNGISLHSTGEHSFTSDEISKMSGNPEDLDITLMNKICWRFWNNGVEFRFKRMKIFMTKIRTERNVVSHEDCKMSETELDQKIKTFQATLEDTLNAAKSLWPNNNGVTIDKQKIGQLKTEIKDVPNFLKKIRGKYDPSEKDDLHKLEEEIKDFWDQLFEYILQLTQKELKSLYGRLCKICFYEWLVQYGVTDPCSTTVSLKMDEQKEFHGCHKGQGCIAVDQNDILDIKDPEGKDPKALIISGCAGAGKSTIMCSVLEKWYKGTTDMPSLPSFPILLYFQFRNQSDDNFDRYIQSLLPNTLGLFALEHVKSAIMSSKCLILCDGYDEANDSSRKLFEELITLNFSDRKVVVTTRPGGTERLTKCINKARLDRINLSVLGLRRKDMKSLLGKITSYLIKDDATRMEMKTELCQVIEDLNETAKVILETPLYFNLFILLYIDCPAIRERVRKEKRISASMLYIHFEEHKKDRIIEKTGMESEYLKKFDNLYLEYSMQNYKKKKYELSQTDVDDMKSRTQCKEVTDNFDSLLSSYFNIKHSIQGLRMKKIYSYRHASELEFAAARKISEDIIKSVGTKTGNIVGNVLISNDVWEQLRKLKYDFPYGNSLDAESLFTFIVGILYHFEREALYSVIDDVHKILVTLTEHYFDLVLTPCLNTISSLDGKVLDSLIQVLKSSSAINCLKIKEASSVFVLPQLIQRLEPKRVEISCFPSVIHFPSLKEAAEVARDRTRFELFLGLDLSNITQFDSFNVDRLHLNIHDYDERVDVNQLCPIPISSKDLYVEYWEGDKRNMLEVSHIINTIWPRRQEREVFETESKGGMSSSQSHSKGNGDEFQHPTLEILRGLKGEEADEGIRLLLDSLNVQPLRRLYLPYFSVSNEEILAELSLECRKRGFGELAGVAVEPEEDSGGAS